MGQRGVGICHPNYNRSIIYLTLGTTTKFSIMKKALLFLSLFSAYVSFCQNTALNIDGTNDNVQTTFQGISGSASRTVEAWIKTTSVTNPSSGGTQKVICDWGDMATGSRFTLNLLQNNSVRIEVGGSGLVGSIAVNDGIWHHIAVVYDTNATYKFTLYIDGLLDTAGNLPTAVNTLSTNSMVIGRRIDGVNFFNGSIDEVRVYNVARTISQIQSDKDKELCSITSDLVAYYKLNEGTPGAGNAGHTAATDYSGNGNTGTLNGFALSGATSNWVNGPLLSGGNTASTLSASNCVSYTSPTGHHVWTLSGTYADTLPNAAGCDSIITVHLTIGSSQRTMTVHSCDTFIAPNGAHLTQSGTYIDTFTSAGGCDSIITVLLTVGTGRYSLTLSACDSFTTLAGHTYSQSGTYSDTIFNHNASGCDSIIVTHLTVYHSLHTTDSISTCDSILINGTWYRSSQTITAHHTSMHGCDSLVTIILTVISINNAVTQTGATLTAQQTGATYAWLDCNTHGLIGSATAATFTSTVNGSFACIIAMNGCSVMSACYTISGLGMSETAINSNIKMMPNPNKGCFIISFETGIEAYGYKIIDLPGRTVCTKTLSGDRQIAIYEPLPTGTYFIQLNTNKGFLHQRFVVE